MSRLTEKIRQLLNPIVSFAAENSLITMCLLFGLAGSILAHCTLAIRLIICITAAVAVIISLAVRQNSLFTAVRSLSAGICIGAVVSIGLFNGYVSHLEGYAGQTVDFRGYIRECVYTTNYSGRYAVQVTDGLPFCRVVLDTMEPDWDIGQVIEGKISLRTLEFGEDGAFDERSYYFAHGIVLAAEDIDCVPAGEVKFSPVVFFNRINSKLSSLFEAHVHGDGLASAVLLGNRDHLSDEAQRDFRRLGILHLLAVSGTHLSVMMVFSERVFINLHIRPRKRLLVQAVICVLYMALTGFSASVVRAGMMHLMLLICKALDMELRYFNALVLSCTVILVLSPFAVLDVGLQLSFLATCGCLMYMSLQAEWEPMKRFVSGKRVKLRELSPFWRVMRKLRQKILSVLSMTAIISLLMLPLSWLYFGEVSLIGFFMGVVYIPAITLFMYLSVFYLLLYPVRLFILPLAKCISLFTSLLLDSASAVSHLPGITLSLEYPFMPFFLIPLCLCILLIPLIQRKGRALIAAGGIFCAMLITVGLFHGFAGQEVRVIGRNVGKNDGFVLQNGTKTVLADVSDGSYTFTKYLLYEARLAYATELDGYLLTHYHERHTATFEKLSDNWILRNLYLPAPQNDKEREIYGSLAAAAERKGIPVVVLEEDPVLFGSLSLYCPARTYLSRSTHPITALILEKEDTRFAYVSSSWNESHGEIGDLLSEAQVIVFGSHSPVYKKTSDLTAVKPDLIVWNGDSADWVDLHTECETVQLYGCGRFVYRFP